MVGAVRGRQVVFWADDSAADRLLVQEALAELGSPVDAFFFDRGEALLARLADTRPDLVVLDVSMPGLTGVETLVRLRGLPGCGGLPVVMFSTAAVESDVHACKALGSLGYQLKPTGFPGFVKAVRGVVQAGLHPGARQAPQTVSATA